MFNTFLDLFLFLLTFVLNWFCQYTKKRDFLILYEKNLRTKKAFNTPFKKMKILANGPSKTTQLDSINVERMILSSCGKTRGKVVCSMIIVFLIFFILSSNIPTDYRPMSLRLYGGTSPSKQAAAVPMWEQTLDFDQLNFGNRTGNPTGCHIVPNYVHFIFFGGTPINYVTLICILAAFKNQRPEKLFFHHDDKNTFTGKYWEVLENTPGFNDVKIFNRVEIPTEIFGQPLSDGWQKWHGSDVMRIQTLMKYGGIYLDRDCYMVKSVDDYRRFEMSLNWDEEGQFLGSQTLIAHKDARFLKKYLDTYKQYDKDRWYYNAGEKPTVEILYQQPELIHRVKVLFGAHIKFAYKTFQEQWDGWKEYMYVIHLLYNHQYLFSNLSNAAVFPVDLNESNIAYYDMTFREMAYDVYDVANIKWPKERITGN